MRENFMFCILIHLNMMNQSFWREFSTYNVRRDFSTRRTRIKKNTCANEMTPAQKTKRNVRVWWHENCVISSKRKKGTF